jgi:adenylate cyclase
LVASLIALGCLPEAQQVARELLDQQPSFHLGVYKRRCPFSGPTLEAWISRLREAGLPD